MVLGGSYIALWVWELQFRDIKPLRGGLYNIVLPNYISAKKACINGNNKDDNCLRRALRSALFPCRKHSDRRWRYPLEDGLNFDGIDAPTPLDQIRKVEKPNNLAKNVLDYENKFISVSRISERWRDTNINVLFIHEETEEGTKSHYVWIKDLNRSLYNQTKHQHRHHFCVRCFYRLHYVSHFTTSYSRM